MLIEEWHSTSPLDCPNYRFKEWTQHERCGLEFTLPAVIPPLPPLIEFEKLIPEDGSTEMIRCITANQLEERYGIVSPPGDVNQPTNGWWLLVTSLDEASPVSPSTLLICLDNLRTLVEFKDTLCFHLADIFRGKFPAQHWLQLIAIVFCRQAKIRVLDKLTHVFERTVVVHEALSTVHTWSCANKGDRPLRRTIWQDRRAIWGHLTRPPDENTNDMTGKWLVTQPKVRPNHLLWISYANTDILQANGTVVLCCPPDLVSYSAMTRYVIREYG